MPKPLRWTFIAFLLSALYLGCGCVRIQRMAFRYEHRRDFWLPKPGKTAVSTAPQAKQLALAGDNLAPSPAIDSAGGTNPPMAGSQLTRKQRRAATRYRRLVPSIPVTSAEEHYDDARMPYPMGSALATARMPRQVRHYLLAPQAAKADGGGVNGLALAGFICGIVAFFLGWFGLALAIAAIVLSAIGLSNINKGKGRTGGRVLAIIGLVLGIVSAVFIIAYNSR